MQFSSETKSDLLNSAAVADAPLPLALCVLVAEQRGPFKPVVARRDAGEEIGRGMVVIGQSAASIGGIDEKIAEAHEKALCWLLARKADLPRGECPLIWRRDHHALVEGDLAAISCSDREVDEDDIALLGLAWLAAIIAHSSQDSRGALRAVAALYRELPEDERYAVQASLVNGQLDAGGLCGAFLARTLRETHPEEQERWESWFLGQRLIDLPYYRPAVIDLLEADMDPDQRRLFLHDTVRNFDYKIEAGNIERIVAQVRGRRQELVFGRMSRAFHNQGLLFANSGYVMIDEKLCAEAMELMVACAGSSLLAAPADRLRLLFRNGAEAAQTSILGAIERLEDCVLDDQRKAVDAQLRADREGHDVEPGDHSEILDRADRLLGMCRALRASIMSAARRPSSYVILSQRLSATGSHLFARINECQEPYLGKAENLKALVRKGAHRMYATPEYAWLHHADHWVEAIPLFIKERVLVIDGQEVTETVIDQETMEESFREQLADHWAINIDNVTDSEHVALARALLGFEGSSLSAEDAGRVAQMAALIANAYRENAAEIHLSVEKDGISRYEALSRWIGVEKQRDLVGLVSDAQAFADEVKRMLRIVDQPRRPLPALHVLTTQSARMSDGYIRTWLEESMALFNVIRAHGLEGAVKERVNGYRDTIAAYGTQLVRELGMDAEVEEMMALENLSEARAISRIVAGNKSISRQVSVMAVLADYFGLSHGEEAPLVEEILREREAELRPRALRAVFERNDLELLPLVDEYMQEHPEADEDTVIRAIIEGNDDYADDLIAFTRFVAREEAIRELDQQDSSLKLAARVDVWMRCHSRLSLTTARRDVLLARGLNHLTLHPLYYYRAAGANKRFHQLYTPSRVDLGIKERESVETWAQWVGGADREGARTGRRVYGLINKNVKMFDSLTEPEVLKTGENASMVANYSYSNAMSLLVNSVGWGDVEELGDQMSLRKDRMIHPGGEGYGGYCVPKDGLFLEFVLILTRATKLRQLGVADHLHAGVVRFGEALLAKRDDFSTEAEWEAWAMERVAARDDLSTYFTLRKGDSGAVPVFQMTRLAVALTQLGRPELTGGMDVMGNLAARWGIHKIIVGGEQVNRFMPFYKTWLTYQATAEAARMNPHVPVKADDFSIVLSAEYKPDTQDGRFSVGMRKFEVFAGTGEHLTYSLDAAGQDLAFVMFQGFDALWRQRGDARMNARLRRLLHDLQIREDDEASLARLREIFPGHRTPAEIRMVSPMGLATSDLMHYTSDTSLEQVAQEVRRRLLNEGLTENEITANMQVYGPRLERWTKLRELPKGHLDSLIARIGGNIHALALSIIGPQGNYETAIQGADVLDTGVPHRDLLAMLGDPVKVRDLMLEGNPHSALVIIDGASGARRRAMNQPAVMRWFAACEAIGRQSIYRCVGVGAESIEGWRETMRRHRGRAQELYNALDAGDTEAARARFADIVDEVREGQEAALFLEFEERMHRFGKQTRHEGAIARKLSKVAAGMTLEELDFSTWLAIGGQYCIIGETRTEMQAKRAIFSKKDEDEKLINALYCPAYVPAVEDFREEKGIESSNKATEEVVAVAIDTRKHLLERAARAKALREREDAYKGVLKKYADEQPATRALIDEAFSAREGEMTQAKFGRLAGLTRLAILSLGERLYADSPAEMAAVQEHLHVVFTGREFDPQLIRLISGGYEDIGDLARLGNRIAEQYRDGAIEEAGRNELLGLLAEVSELFDCCRAIDLTIGLEAEQTDQQVWRALADFFAESINDHFYPYSPWAYSRGVGFADIDEAGLYALSVERHHWLYQYLKNVAITRTELRDMPQVFIDELLGDMDAESAAIGADAECAVERRWRAYNQLREIAFIRNDGFPLPQVFPAFDPEIIEADTRVNMLYMYPVGRTHVSRSLMEGPTLTEDLRREGKPGVNLIIARDAEQAQPQGFARPVLQVLNGHLYISRAEYVTALQRHRGMSAADSERLANEHAGPKGVRIAARFTRPVTLAVVFPFHGHSKFTSGLLEEMGLPYSSQSRFHEWTTYDKAKYPAIFTPDTGVDIPGEMDWLARDTEALGEEDTRRALEFGDEGRAFPGFRAFSQQHRIVMVKDATESGGRGQKAFVLRHTDGSFDEAVIAEAVEFTYQISLKHNVAIQEVIISSPEYWGTEEFLQSFVDRQILEWGVAVNRTQRPRTNIYGSHRIIFSSDDPAAGKWHISHPITLNSRQLITNVGRGGTLDIFRREWIRPEFRERLMARMQEAGEKAMAALGRYGEIAQAKYREETGRGIGADATGLSYAMPRYMMLDFLVQPVFAEEGTLIDLEPVYDDAGRRVDTRFVLQQGGERVIGTVKDWRVVLIEPNIGIGLWDRLAIREEFYAAQGTETPDPRAIGEHARIVLGDFAAAGRGYLGAVCLNSDSSD